MIYLMQSGTFFKVGFTSNLEKRIKAYATHNPQAKLLAYAITYAPTKRALESEIHKELKNMGFQFHKSALTQTESEWFEPNEDFRKVLETQKLKAFKACRNRKMVDA